MTRHDRYVANARSTRKKKVPKPKKHSTNSIPLSNSTYHSKIATILLAKALPFALNAATQTGTATTAEHYLAQVHAQASALPTILRASGRAPDNLTSHPSNGISKQGHRNPRTRSTPPEKAPNKIWQEHICQDYTRLQTALQGTAFKKTNAATQIPELREEWRAYFLKHRPSLPILRQLDFIALQDAIHALDEAVPKEEEPALEALVNAGLAEWAFSLLAFIEPYVDRMQNIPVLIQR